MEDELRSEMGFVMREIAGLPISMGQWQKVHTQANQLYDLLMKRGERLMNMAIPDNLPDPTVEYADFLIGLMALEEDSNLVQYRNKAGKNARLWVIRIAQHIAEALQDEIVEVSLITTPDDERVNGYHPMPGAREFWKNGLEEGLKPQEIIDGWKALMSMTKEGSSGEAAQA